MFKLKPALAGLILATALALVSCAPQAVETPAPAALPSETAAPVPPTEGEQTPPTTEAGPISGRVNFEQLGVSLEVPEGLSVIKDPVVNLDDPTRLQAYLFYIQNYGPSEGPGQDYFQMYGHLQYDLPPTTWEEYVGGVLNSDMYAYAREIEVNGLRGIDSQFAGERNRFVYHFLLDGRVLSIAVSDPTDANKALADSIISTLQYLPGSISGASRVQLINEPSGYYQMYLPDSWAVSFNPPAGIRLSDLAATSPGAVVAVEESDGPHDIIRYQSGVTLSVAVLEDDSALAAPAAAQVISSTPLMLAGIEGTDYVFLEPSTAEGQIREVRFYHNNLSYLVRFGFAADADLEEIDWLIRNFQITP